MVAHHLVIWCGQLVLVPCCNLSRQRAVASRRQLSSNAAMKKRLASASDSSLFLSFSLYISLSLCLYIWRPLSLSLWKSLLLAISENLYVYIYRHINMPISVTLHWLTHFLFSFLFLPLSLYIYIYPSLYLSVPVYIQICKHTNIYTHTSLSHKALLSIYVSMSLSLSLALSLSLSLPLCFCASSSSRSMHNEHACKCSWGTTSVPPTCIGRWCMRAFEPTILGDLGLTYTPQRDYPKVCSSHRHTMARWLETMV